MSNSDWDPKFGPMPNMVQMYGATPFPREFEPTEPVQWPPKDTVAPVATQPEPTPSPSIGRVFAEIIAALEQLPKVQQRRVIEAVRNILELGP